MNNFVAADICFSMCTKNWLSKAIAWFMGSKWSHSFIVIESSKLYTYVCETSDFEVTIGVLEDYLVDPTVNLVVYRINTLSLIDRDKIVKECLKNNREMYGYLQLISLGIRRLLKRIGIHIPNFIRQGIVCDQNVLYGYTKSRVPTLAGIDPESIDTEEFYQLILDLEKNKIAQKVFEKRAFKC